MKIGQTNDIKFRVNVMGTSADATVRVILGTSPLLTFPAHKTGVENEWLAALDLPDGIHPGEYDLKVEVMVGNRHFTPLTKKITLDAKDEPRVSPSAAIETPAVPPGTDVQTEAKKLEPKKEEPKKSLLKAILAAGAKDGSVVPAAPVEEISVETTEIEIPKAPKKISFPKDFFKFEAKPVEPVQIYMPPITTTLMHLASDQPAPQVVEINHGTPIHLVKGEIIYE